MPKTKKITVQVIGEVPFLQFWELYPRKKAKPIAKAKWEALTTEIQQLILKDIPKRVEGREWQKDDGEYIPHPATYINQERWEDSIEKGTKSNVKKY